MVGLQRFGVFLRPDPRTCAAVTTITGQIRSQYGLVSAGAFPPHATLVGSLPLARGVESLVGVLDQVLDPIAPFEVENRGVQRLGEVLVYDVHDRDGRPNPDLLHLKSEVDRAVRPLLSATPPGQLPADVHLLPRWRAHISLASHELFGRPDLLDELDAYVTGLAVAVPPTFWADTVCLYRFEHSTWSGSWWEDLTWEYLRSWRLRPRS